MQGASDRLDPTTREIPETIDAWDTNAIRTRLFFASLLTLFFELLVIRYLATEVRAFTNLKNLPLVASFLGIGLGMLLGMPGKKLRAAFPVVGAILFISIRFAQPLHLSVGDLSWEYSLGSGAPGMRVLFAFRFLAIALSFSALVVVFFLPLGGFVGHYLQRVPALMGYGINLAGSLAGLVVFSLSSFSQTGPAIWLLIGFGLLMVFVHDRITVLILGLVICVVAIPQPNTFWSPYYRIDLIPLKAPAGWPQISAYSLVTNHVWYQYLADLSPEFLAQNPAAEPNRFLLPYYELPYQLVPSPRNVLILGAGTGNDVAGALRHGASHVDAVEIDPVILRLGKKYHPEHPYDSPRVTAYQDDARAFLKRGVKKYDLIVFSFLDSTTLLGGFSSLRLDNYVYTVESFQDAKTLLAENGTLVLSFATGRSFASDRLYATMERAFGVPPAAYYTGALVNGVFLVEGQARNTRPAQLVEVADELQKRSAATILATDNWPFLYLTDRSIPGSILVTISLFVLTAWMVLRKSGRVAWPKDVTQLHFFLLGAGFLLLEIKAVTQFSLLFGSTWIVNSLVIGAFLMMAIIANAVASSFRVSTSVSYGLLLILLIVDLWFPYSLINATNVGLKILLGGVWAALPVFFSGVVFSSSLKRFGRSAEMLAVNLFGAVVGGILENAVMVGGTPILKILAIGIYIASAVSLFVVSKAQTGWQQA